MKSNFRISDFAGDDDLFEDRILRFGMLGARVTLHIEEQSTSRPALDHKKMNSDRNGLIS